MLFAILRFALSAIVGLLEQNVAYSTDYPKPVGHSWPLFDVCEVLSDDSVDLSPNVTWTYLSKILPQLLGLYYNTTGEATSYCIDPTSRTCEPREK